MIHAITRDLRLAWQNFYRNIWLSIATMVIIILTLFSVNILVVVNTLSHEAVIYLQDKVDITIYLKSGVTREQAEQFYNHLQSHKSVAAVAFIPREESYRAFSERYTADSVIQESLIEIGENPLGDSFRVRAHDLAGYGEILKAVDQEPYSTLVEQRDFRNYTEVIDNVRAVTEKIEKGVLILTATLLLIATLVLFNTIRMTIYTRRQEIGVMKLVGASNWFVSGPFFIESMLYALVAFGLMILLLLPTLRLIHPYVAALFPDSSFTLAGYYASNWWHIFRWQLGGVILLSVLSSAIAIQRYLRV